MPSIILLETVARECGRIVHEERARKLSTTEKEEQLGAHFSTNADTLSETHALARLRKENPKEILIGEEEDTKMEIPPNCTVIDPLDGTTLYFNRGREYGVTLCTLRNGQPEAGVMYWPEDDVLISAVRAKGCWRGGFEKGQRLFIPPWHGMRDKMLVSTDLGQWTALEVLERIAKQHSVVSYMAAIYGARVILEGVAALYLNLNIAKIWDGAAGALAVQEAGGIALSPHGRPLQWNTRRLDWFYARDQEIAEYAIDHLKHWQPRN